MLIQQPFNPAAMKSVLLVTLCSFCFIISSAQPLTLLKQIGTEVNSKTGVGQTFYGVIMTNGELFFQASQDGFYDEVWKTDGTGAGTELVLTTQGNQGWSGSHFTTEGIFFNTYNDHLLWYDANLDQTMDLGFYDDVYFRTFGKISDEEYIVQTYTDTLAQWWITDKTADGTRLLGDIGKQNAFLEMYTSYYGAVIYNTNSFITYEPLFYAKDLDTIISVKDFLAPYKELNKIRTVFLYENLMFVAVREGNFDKNYIFDLDTYEFHPTPFTAEVIAFVPYQNELILLTKRYLFIVDRSTFEIQSITDNVYPFSSYLLDGDRFYYIFQESSGDLPAIYYVDLTDNTNHALPDAEIGSNHYDSRIVSYHNEIYYTKREQPSIFLRKFNPATEVTTIIDTIAVNHGSLTIINALDVVNDVLITSRYTQSLGHELYYLDGTSQALLPFSPMSQIHCYPNPAVDYLYFDMPETDGEAMITLYDGSGKLVLSNTIVNKRASVQSLNPGLYTGLFKDDNMVRSFRFTKQ